MPRKEDTMFKRTGSALALTAAAGLVLAGCSSSGEEPTDAPTTSAGGANSGGDISLVAFNGWDESIATSLLWQNILNDKGYNATVEYAEAGTGFQGVADGDYDVVTDVWLPLTHATYIESYGDDMEELGTWFDQAKLTIAVNADAPVDSLADLPDYVDEMGGRIVGIEPGAGLTAATENAIDTYGLDDFEFTTSSTPAMLAELDKSLDDEENVIVTLWEPHWAYGAYDLKNLEDPEGVLGEAENIITYSRTGFGEDFPEVAQWLSDFTMDAASLYNLENKLQGADSADYETIVDEWVSENQEWVDSLTA